MATLPIASFLTEVLTEYDPTFQLRYGTGFEQLFFEPISFITQPLSDEATMLQVAQSFSRILAVGVSTTYPLGADSFPQESVDALASNLFVTRIEGNAAGGLAYAYYDTPVDREYPTGGATFDGNNGLTYSNTAPFAISSTQMSSQISNGLYYFEIPVTCDTVGAASDLPAGGLVTLEGDADVIDVTNLLAFSGGLNQETNTDLITRTQNSIGVRDLVTGNGFNAILFQNFPSNITALQPVGFGDPEMMRDIFYNIHTGGYVDGYMSTPALQQGTFNAIGLLIDTTRNAYGSANVQLFDTDPSSLNEPNIVTQPAAPAPVVIQIKASTPALFYSSVNLSNPINLSVYQYVAISIDGGPLTTIRIAGVNPAATQRNEIIALINGALGATVAYPSANSIYLKSPTNGVNSSIVIGSPSVGSSYDATLLVFGLAVSGEPYIYNGTGPLVFLEGINYTVDYVEGTITRIVGATIVSPTLSQIVAQRSTGQTTLASQVFYDATSGVFAGVNPNDVLTITSGADAGAYYVVSKTNNNTLVLNQPLTATADDIGYNIFRAPGSTTNNSAVFVDNTANQFLDVQVNDIVTVLSGPDIGDYRVLSKTDNNHLVVDANFTATTTGVNYIITRTGIKSGETVYVTYYFNPLSIDVGNLVLQADGITRGVRPGRAKFTISDTAFIRINQIQLIDPLTQVPTGTILSGNGGFGVGGFGQGPFGVGSGGDYRLIVNVPTARFSAFEDSYILINSGYQGLSLQITYDYAPEVQLLHTFVRSETNRVLDSDFLMKHFIPGYVSGTIKYRGNPTNSSLPTPAQLAAIVVAFINALPPGSELEYSNIAALIGRTLDPNNTYGTFVTPFTLTATVYMEDGSIRKITGTESILPITLNPFPSYTPAPVSPRIMTWIADQLTFTQINATGGPSSFTTSG